VKATQRQKYNVNYEIVIILAFDRRKVFVSGNSGSSQTFPYFEHDTNLDSDQKRSLMERKVLDKFGIWVDRPVSETEVVHQFQGNWHVSTCYRIDVSAKDHCRAIEPGDWKLINSVLDGADSMSYVRTALELLGLARINAIRV